MLTPVERVLVLRGVDLLRDVGPRHLLELADAAREFELGAGDRVYGEEDAADALYMLVEGRVRLSVSGDTIAEIGPGEAFGTWALVDDAARGQTAECIEDGLALALHRDAFYDVAAEDMTLLREVLRALARRLRALVADKPHEARVEGEGVETPVALSEAAAQEEKSDEAPPSGSGAQLVAAVLDHPVPAQEGGAPEAAAPEATPPGQTEPSL